MSDSEDALPKKKVKVIKKKKIPKKRKRALDDDRSNDNKSEANSIDNDLMGIGSDLPSKRFKDNESQPASGFSKLL